MSAREYPEPRNHIVTINVRDIPYPGPNDTTASFLRMAAERHGTREFFGSNVTHCVKSILLAVADQLDAEATS